MPEKKTETEREQELLSLTNANRSKTNSYHVCGEDNLDLETTVRVDFA